MVLSYDNNDSKKFTRLSEYIHYTLLVSRKNLFNQFFKSESISKFFYLHFLKQYIKKLLQ